MSELTISEVARQVGLQASAIRYYERIGLLPRAPRMSGQRRYDTTALYRLAIIQRARQLGHEDILDHVSPINIRTLTNSLQKLPALKSTLSCSVIDGVTVRPELGARRRSTHAENEIDIDARAVVEFRQHFGTSRAAAC